MKKLITIIGAFLLACSLPLSGAAAGMQAFFDVPPTKHFSDMVNELAARNIIGGYPDGSFKPNEPIKRKNMAAILVKAFDLPHDTDVKNPFKGEVGITPGTSPSTLSPNASITRGQAAKMLAATEQVMVKNAVTMGAGDLGWDTIESVIAGEINPGVFRAVEVKGKKDGTQDQVQLFPIKEGKSGIAIAGRKADNGWENQKYYVHVKKEGGELRLTLEKTDESLPTMASLNTKYKTVQNIALAKVDGENISDNVKIEKTEYNFTYIVIEKPGDYIATIRFANGDEVRYSVSAFEMDDSFFYGTSAIELGPADFFE